MTNQATPAPSPGVYTTEDVAKRYDIGMFRVRQLAKARGVGRQLTGGTWIFTDAEVELLRPGKPGRPKVKAAS